MLLLQASSTRMKAMHGPEFDSHSGINILYKADIYGKNYDTRR